MRRRSSFIVLLLSTLAATASAEQAKELTFFSNTGFSGAQYTVTGDRAILDVPFAPRSAMLRGGGTWELCGSRAYRAPCQKISDSQRELRLGFQRVASVRGPAGGPPALPGGWREVARKNVTDSARSETVPVNDKQSYTQVMICSEKNTIRVRRAEVRLGRTQWQRLFVPLAIKQGECSKAIDLTGGSRRITAFRFEYEAWSAGWKGGTIVARAKPEIKPQPR